MIIQIYKFFDNIKITRFLMDIIAWIKLKIIAKKLDSNILINKEWIKEMNIPYEWFTENKPLGISWIARLKNAEDFLEIVVESHIPFLDEIILVDNMSTDNTKKICLKLAEKYQKKIKFFEYNYNILPIWTKNLIWNSLYSFSYYTNWCFSKSSYKYVMRLDDDNLLISQKWKKIRKYILEKIPKKYIAYWWYNLFKKNNNIWICKNDIYSWKYWDHWIYPVSVSTYYIQNEIWEELKHNLFFKRFNLTFLHLKYLKKNFGLKNCILTEIGKERRNLIEKSESIKIENFIRNNKDLDLIKNIIKNILKINKY